MSWSEITVVITVLLGLGLWCVWVAASRLDRLHRKMNASRAVVDAQLVRRATVAAELATSGLLDPVSSVLVGEAAWASLSAGLSDTTALPPDLAGLLAGDDHETSGTDLPLDRSRVESELSATLREALDDEDEVTVLRADPSGDELLGALGSAWYRLQLARRFHNEAVAQAARARRGPVVRALRLAGRAPTPRTLDLDDEWPESLGRPGARAHGADGSRSGV
ncbi:membrane protein [Cellulomonas chitinilytica]|uniref:Membrane protein n=1 Tax=Cellulomonas chitinilytica TaxID=398759 RepID=A0A919TYB6_9CELL|nr:hypothetical protein [Cellulomonas chitinilytica]GIG20420.1 membrane protein [Cellulomonas chitinilytica]